MRAGDVGSAVSLWRAPSAAIGSFVIALPLIAIAQHFDAIQCIFESGFSSIVKEAVG